MQFDSPLIMAILNITPDSFSGDGILKETHIIEQALKRASKMIEDGADILDIGGESTRPNHTPVPAEIEIERVIPIIHEIHKNFPQIPLSIDTIKLSVAEKAFKMGVSIINDISGGFADPELLSAVAEWNTYYVLTHNGHYFSSHDKAADETYEDIFLDEMEGLIERSLQKGIKLDNLILDPGIGFGKTPEQNIYLIKNLEKLKTFSIPILIGVSRKSYIFHLTQAPVYERLPETLISNCIGIMKGANIVRVHDVKEMKKALITLEALY